MSIFTVNLKRILKSRVQLVFIILFPLSLMSMSVFHVDHVLKAAIVDKDQTELTRIMAKEMASIATISALQEEDIEKELMGLKVDYVLVIEQGFTKGLIQGKAVKIKGYSVQESNMSLPIKTYTDGFLHNVKQIAHAADQSEETFYKALNAYQNGSLQMRYQSAVDSKYQTSRSVFGFLAVSMLYSSMVTAMLIIMNKNNRTFYRTLAAPVSIRKYMLQNIASFLVVSLIQIVVLFAILIVGFDIYLGTSAFDMFVLFIVFALVCVSLGITVSAYSKTIVQAGILGICVIPPMSMLGGAYWPMDQVPQAVKTIAQFVPVTWAMKGVEKLLREQSLAAISAELVMLLLFAAIFFLLGTLRRADIAK